MIVNSSRNSNSNNNNNGNSISNSKSHSSRTRNGNSNSHGSHSRSSRKVQQSLSVTAMVVVILNVIVIDIVTTEAIAEVADLARVKSYKMWVFEGGVPYIYIYIYIVLPQTLQFRQVRSCRNFYHQQPSMVPSRGHKSFQKYLIPGKPHVVSTQLPPPAPGLNSATAAPSFPGHFWGHSDSAPWPCAVQTSGVVPAFC